MKKLNVVHSSSSITGERICFPFGSKIEVHDVYHETGGGGTNTAVGFARLGLAVGYFGKIGTDVTARTVLAELRSENVDVSHVVVDKSKGTGQSIIMTGPAGERTVWVYRGSNNNITRRDIPYHYLSQTRWLYLAPLSGESMRIIEPILSYSEKNHILVALNPNKDLLSLGLKKISPLLARIHFFLLNLEEASTLTGIPTHQKHHIIREVCQHVRGVVVITDGAYEIMASDGSSVFSVMPPRMRAVSALGAGDAFASGFLAYYIKQHHLDDCLRAGVINSQNVVMHIGAKKGLLTKLGMRRWQNKFRSIRVKKLSNP